MNKGLLTIAVAGSMIVGLTSLAMADAGIPDAELSTASSASGCIRIEPAGTGDSLASQGLTVSVTLRDSETAFIVDLPSSDVWLDDDGTGVFAICPGGSTADLNTNALGETTISGAIAGGGHTQSGLYVYACGVKLNNSPLAIDIVSTDINGDLKLDIIDVGYFAEDFHFGTGPFRSDFNCDGVVNLSDVGNFAQSYFASVRTCLP